MNRALTGPAARGILHTALQVILALALFAALLLLATRHNRRFDTTSDKAYSLSDHARRVAEQIDQPLSLTGFYSSQQGDVRREMADLLDQFKRIAPTLEYRLLDLDRSPRESERLGVSSYNTGVIEAGDRRIALRAISEEEITHALLELGQRQVKTVCFITGHAERDPRNTDDREGYSEVAKSLESENFTIRSIPTIPTSGVPGDCAVLILAGAKKELLPGETQFLDQYFRGGGKGLILVDPDAPKSLVEYLQSIGIEAGNDLVVDERNRFLGADSFTPRVPIFDQGTYGNALRSAAVFSLARTIRPMEDSPPQGMKVGLLALGSEDSWALVNPGDSPADDVQFRPDVDRAGPLPMGAVAFFGDPKTAPPEKPPGQLLVFGDSDFASNFFLNLIGNKDLFLSSIAVLAAEPELVGVRQKGSTRGTLSSITLTERQGQSIFTVSVLAVPAVFLIAGGIVTWRRSGRRGGR